MSEPTRVRSNGGDGHREVAHLLDVHSLSARGSACVKSVPVRLFHARHPMRSPHNHQRLWCHRGIDWGGGGVSSRCHVPLTTVHDKLDVRRRNQTATSILCHDCHKAVIARARLYVGVHHVAFVHVNFAVVACGKRIKCNIPKRSRMCNVPGAVARVYCVNNVAQR